MTVLPCLPTKLRSQYWFPNHQIGLSNALIPSAQEYKGDLRACFSAWACGTAGHSNSWRVMTAACVGPPVPVLMEHWHPVLRDMQCFGFIPSTHWPSEISRPDSWLLAQSSRSLCPPLKPGANERGNSVSKSHNSLLRLLLGWYCYASPFLQANCCLTALS